MTENVHRECHYIDQSPHVNFGANGASLPTLPPAKWHQKKRSTDSPPPENIGGQLSYQLFLLSNLSRYICPSH